MANHEHYNVSPAIICLMYTRTLAHDIAAARL